MAALGQLARHFADIYVEAARLGAAERSNRARVIAKDRDAVHKPS
jgi:hypothetical protein